MNKFAYWQFTKRQGETSRDKIIEAIKNTLQLNVRGSIYSGMQSKRDRQTGDHAAPSHSTKESV